MQYLRVQRDCQVRSQECKQKGQYTGKHLGAVCVCVFTYSFNYGPVHFIVLDGETPSTRSTGQYE